VTGYIYITITRDLQCFKCTNPKLAINPLTVERTVIKETSDDSRISGQSHFESNAALTRVRSRNVYHCSRKRMKHGKKRKKSRFWILEKT